MKNFVLLSLAACVIAGCPGKDPVASDASASAIAPVEVAPSAAVTATAAVSAAPSASSTAAVSAEKK